MTEAEWLASDDPTPMLEFLKEKATSRKLRLLCCAWFRMTSSEGEPDGKEQRHAIHVAELFADGMATEEERQSVEDEMQRLNNFHDTCYVAWRCVDEEYHFTYIDHPIDNTIMSHLLKDYPVVLNTFRFWTWPKLIRGKRQFWHQLQTQLFRDFFGNPFHPVSLNPAWLTSRGRHPRRADVRVPRFLHDADSCRCVTRCRVR
jgi:hypothetical protein